MTAKTNYGRVVAGAITIWLAAAVTASALGLFAKYPERPPLALLIAVLVPTAIFTTWYLRSRSFREYILGLNPRTVTVVHSWRLVGIVFLVLGTYRILPQFFALSAGWGDIVIGATALPVAMLLARPNHKVSFIAWQILGIADLVIAILLGAVGKFIYPQEIAAIPTTPMTILPLSLIPGFAVPLLLILHGISIVQAKQWRSEARDVQTGAESLPVV